MGSEAGVPYIMSIGILTCLPNMRKNGVYVVVGWTLELYAKQRGLN